MRTVTLAIGALLVLSACAAPAVISDINDSSLKIQVNSYTPPEEIAARAAEGCAIYGKQPTAAISNRCMDGYCSYREILFACH